MIEIRTIHCPVDFSPISLRNVRMGVELCKRIGARLVLHHNLDVRPPGYLSVSWMWSEDHESEEERKAEEVPDKLEELFATIPEGIEYEARVTKGPIEDTVLFVARGLPADLIIMGTHGKTSADHDSLTERIVIQAPCSVLTIGESYEPEAVFDALDKPPVDEMRFLVPVDLTTQAKRVLELAMGVAEGMPHTIDLLHVVSPVQDGAQEEREVEAARKRLENQVPEALKDRVRVLTRVGNAAEQILTVAEETRPLCIVMGAHAKGMLKRFLFGTKTMNVLHGAPCPVWFVPEA
jgi:nucleotide-binding universal stress UspA family protein